MDQRNRARIPYGYEITEGRAEIDEEEAQKLFLFYRKYLEGSSMSEAAREALLPYCQTSLRHLLSRKEYVGTDFYPPLVSKEYQERLISEWNRRKGEKPRQSKARRKRRGVPIYTEFFFTSPINIQKIDLENPIEYLTELYQRIMPVTT